MANEQTIENHEITNPYEVPIEEGEVICPKCKGLAFLDRQQGAYSSCNRCWGDGKLDWIELVMGKERPYAVSGVSASSSRSSSSVSIIKQDKTKRRNANGINSKFRFRTIQRFFKMPYKSKGSL